MGARGEDLALEHLRRLGFEPIARNVRSARGEIDLIVFDGVVLAFVEVKSACARPSPAAGGGGRNRCPVEPPLARLREDQRTRLRGLALAWLQETSDRPRAQEIRFDAIGVILDRSGRLLRLDHVENAW